MVELSGSSSISTLVLKSLRFFLPLPISCVAVVWHGASVFSSVVIHNAWIIFLGAEAAGWRKHALQAAC